MNKNIRFYSIIGGIIFVLIILGIIYYFGFSQTHKQNKLNQSNIDKLNFISAYIQSQFRGNYPYPEGDIFLLDKNFRQIYPTENEISFEYLDNLYIIQGTTCSIRSDSSDFLLSNFDSRFSSGDNKKCFSYAVTKDRKYFQVGSIIENGGNYISYLTGNFSGSITKDFLGNFAVEIGKKEFLPYNPGFNHTVSIKLVSGEGNLNIVENGKDLGFFDLSENGIKNIKGTFYKNNIINNFISLPLTDTSKDLDLSFSGNSFVYKIIYPNGAVQTVRPDLSGHADIQIRGVNFDGNISKASVFNNIGNISYNFPVMGERSNFVLYDDKSSVVNINGSNINLYVNPDYTFLFLNTGNVNFRNELNNYIINDTRNIVGIDKNHNYSSLGESPDIFKNILNAVSYSSTNDISESKIINDQSLSLSGKYYDYFIQNNKNISFITGEILNTDSISYKLFVFSGNISSDFLSKITANKIPLNSFLKNICIQNKYTDTIYLKDAYNLVKSDTEYSSFNTDFNLGFKDYNMLINSSIDLQNNLNILYFNNIEGKFKFGNISENGNGNTIIICK